MKPTDLHLFRAYGRPVVAPDGDVIAALSTPDLEADSYRSVLQRLRPGHEPEDFTHGPRDSAPVLSPDGETVIFLRAGESGPPQLYAMPRHGGEPRKLAEHPLGASAVTFAPDGRSIAYLAAVPEPGRYGTPLSETSDDTAEAGVKGAGDGAGNEAATGAANAPRMGAAKAPRRAADKAPDRNKPAPEAEAPRRITRMSYRSDGKGFVLDKPEQVFVLDLAGALCGESTPRQLTAEEGTIGRPAFTPDGRELLYVRRVAPDTLRGEIAAVPADADEPRLGRTLITADGDATMPVAHGDTIYFFGSAYSGNDFPGHTVALWAAPLAGGAPRRMTDELTVHCEPVVGEPVVTDGAVLVPVADRGAVGVRAVPLDAADLALDRLPALIGGQRVVKAFSVTGTTLAAVVADPQTTGDIVTAEIDDAATHAGPETTPTVPDGSLDTLQPGPATSSRRASPATVSLTVPDGSLDAPQPGPATSSRRASPATVSLTDVSADLRDAGLARQVEITATAPDGYPVHGWLVLPPEGAFDGPRPVLLDVHGGPHAAYTWGVFDEAQMYATNGYAVVLPNPRGSSGYGLQHGRAIVGALGTVDADDVLALLDAALARPDCDADRVGVMGGSYGGFMTSWLASQAADRFVAGISERAVNAWDSFSGASDIGFFFAEGYVGPGRDEQWAKSPLVHADRIGIPLLIIHSEQDWRCPLEQAQRLFVALKLRGHETEMLVFPGEGHELSRSGRPRHRQQRFEAILEWWNRYLPAG